MRNRVYDSFMHDYSETDDNFELNDDGAARRSEFTIAEDQAGQRLDRFLAAQFPAMSRTHVQTLIDEGRVLVSGIAKKPSHHVESGEQITVEIPAPPLPGVAAENIPLTLLYEDADIAVVNKPAGMIVHPGAGADSGTLVAALLVSLRRERALHGRRSPAAGHCASPGQRNFRRDCDRAQRRRTLKLIEEFRERRVQKTYLALLHGKVKGTKGTIELPVARDLNRRSRMTSRRSEGREARTDWRLRLRIGNFSFIEADLHTGRTHQIRVHFSALGFPVVGDTLYGAPRQERIGTRVAAAARAQLSSCGAHRICTPTHGRADGISRAVAGRAGEVHSRARRNSEISGG